MPHRSSTPASPVPKSVVAELDALRSALDTMVPARTSANLVIGTWNVRAFDSFTPKWRSRQGDSPIRDRSNVACLAEIVRRFDVVAIQEVRRSAQAFLEMMSMLGDDWAYLVTDVTEGSAGNGERLAFVFDTTRVKPSGLACEVVVAPDARDAAASKLVGHQFARTPYAISLARADARFTLVTLHVVYGKAATDRIAELTEIAEWLRRWAHADDAWGGNLIALGDFNIDRSGDPLYEAFTSTGLRPPAPLNLVPRTVFDDPDPAAAPDHRHFYDQIAWFGGDSASTLRGMSYTNAGMVDFLDRGIPAHDVEQLSWRISDHFPLWCEFDVRA